MLALALYTMPMKDLAVVRKTAMLRYMSVKAPADTIEGLVRMWWMATLISDVRTKSVKEYDFSWLV